MRVLVQGGGRCSSWVKPGTKPLSLLLGTITTALVVTALCRGQAELQTPEKGN